MGFHASADVYERGRPDYPQVAIDFLADQLGLATGATVLDIGAGTGKLSRRLVPTGARVIGLEPIAGMRRKFVELLPALEILEASAEAIPMPDQSLDAACAGQAFHWLANSSALGEIRRVLEAGGGLGLIWNRLDRSSGWASETGEIVDRLKGDAPKYEDRRWSSAFDQSDGFERIVERTFSHAQTADLSTVLARFESISHVALLSTHERKHFIEQFRAILASDPETAGRDRVGLSFAPTPSFTKYQAR